jgi:hypothetical protein
VAAIGGVCRRWGGFGCGSRCAVAAADEPEHLAHGDHFALAPFDARQDAILFGGDVEIDLVGLQLDEAIPSVDRVALLLQPGADDRIDQRLTERWNPNFNRHAPYSASIHAR